MRRVSWASWTGMRILRRQKAERPVGFEAFTGGKIPGSYRIWPHKTAGEGHFLALVHKKGTEASTETLAYAASGKLSGKKKRRKKPPEWKEGQRLGTAVAGVCEGNAGNGTGAVADSWWELYHVWRRTVSGSETDGGYEGPEGDASGTGSGNDKEGRFEPSHGLALFLKKEWAGQWINLPSDSEEITRYLRGETLNTDQLPGERHLTGKNGWVLVCVDGCSLGWSKKVGITLKNHYPKGLRRP